MVRNLLGSLLALLGAAGAAWSPYGRWYADRQGRDFRLPELFSGTGITDARAGLGDGLFVPMACAALLVLVGVALRSRLTVAFAGLLVLGFTVLWMVRQTDAAGTLTTGERGLGPGAAGALCGGLAILIGALVMRGRRRDGGRYTGRQRAGDPPYDDEDGPAPWDPVYDDDDREPLPRREPGTGPPRHWPRDGYRPGQGPGAKG